MQANTRASSSSKAIHSTKVIANTVVFLIIMRASFRFFNGFPVVNWNLKLLKAGSRPSIIMRMAVA
jgi:hypothetical protein